MRIAVIINPIAGRGRRRAEGAARRDHARTIVGAAGIEATIAVSERAGHARTLAADAVAADVDAVIVWGGDGTVNEAAGPLLGTRIALGIVPCGSGDGLARGLGLPLDPRAVVAAAVRGTGHAIDAGFVGPRHFLNIAGVGFDAAVAAAFDRRGRFGALSYAAAAIGRVWSYRPERYRLTLEGVPADGPLFLVAFANSRQYGNGLVLAPHADPADGRLDVVVVDGGSPVEQIWRARRLVVRPLTRARGVMRARVSTASIEGARLVCHVDGEPFETGGTLDVRVETEAIRIVGAGLGRAWRPAAVLAGTGAAIGEV
ncbi:MAG TPA: diacylglycerol kinase family protein [Vicinamibacterales bacterium]|nr:diacylglycerol kinase family protein [Vicinamibacterales bacterium]